MGPRITSTTSLTVRPAVPGDAAAIARLAQLDSAPVPRGALILGLADGHALAALSVETGAVVADPFVRTAELVSLLRARAEGVRRAEGTLVAVPSSPGLRRALRGGRVHAA